MPISKAQTSILELAYANNGFLDPTMSPLRGGALNKVITALQNKSFLAPENMHGYPITNSGKEALGILNKKPAPQEARKGTKTEKLIQMLKRKKGATNAQIQKALNWQPHSVRGIISGTLKKKMGFEISAEKNKAGDLTYKIPH